MASRRGGPPTAINCEEIQIQVESWSPPENDLNLFLGSANDYLELGVPLYRAALEGDWETAKAILQQDQNLARARISRGKETALHIAAAARRTDFVKELVKYMNNDDLALQSAQNNTALCFAAASGTVEIARVMVEKNKSLPLIRGSDGMTPLFMATLLGHRDMVWYLASVTNFNQFARLERFELLITAINSELYDVALEIVKEYPDLATYQDADGKTALQFLARKCLKSHSVQVGSWTKWARCTSLASRKYNLKQDQASKLVQKLWGEFIKLNYEDIILRFGSPSYYLFDAAEVGNVEFIAILIGSYPDLIWKVNKEKDLLATFTDSEGNNMLHLAAMSPPRGALDSISGAALQMQRELLWYKEVESVVQPQFRESKNQAGKTPRSLFIEEHESLRKEGENWMKTTANSCSVVATLITTVAFTAAFTVPGGNDQEKGTPIFQRNPTFVVFAIADAISLFSSSMAILMFLGILTSRYAQEDFLKSLPLKLMTGLSSLFLSITSMMVAFASTFFIIFKARSSWISIPISVAILVAVPVILFAFQQFSLLVDIYRSTYQARYLFRPKKHKIFREHKTTPFLRRLAF